MSDNYAKLACDIIHSSIWCQPDDGLCKLWVTLLAMADRDGIVNASDLGIARAVGHAVEVTRANLVVLQAPDPDSKNPAHEGRRVEALQQGGYRLLNYESYRDRNTPEEKAAKNAARQRRHRERKRGDALDKPPPLKPPAETGSGPLLPDAPTPAQLLAREWMRTQGRYKGDEARQLADLAKWAKALEDMTRLDGVVWERVEAIARWVMRDVEGPGAGNGHWMGWGTVVQSPMKLRSKNRDGARYHEVIAEKMDRGEKPSARRSSISNDPADYRPEDDIDFDAPLPDIVRKPKTDQRHEDDIDF